MRTLTLSIALFFSAAIFAEDHPPHSLAYRAKLMMNCNPELATKQFSLGILVGQSAMMEFDFSGKYEEAYTLYTSMKTCEDVERAYAEYVKVAQFYGKNTEEYWKTEEGARTLVEARNYLNMVMQVLSEKDSR